MSSETIQVAILNRLLTIIESDFTSGFSGINLTGRVVFGATVGANVVPSANLIYVDTIEQQGRTLGRYVGESVFQIVCYTSGGDIKSRITSALNLGGDIQKAITTDRSLGLLGRTEDVIVNMTATDGEEYGINQCGICLLEVRINHQSQYGT